MKITVIDGNKATNELEAFVSTYAAELRKHASEVLVFPLRDMTIKHCSGCSSCSTKTPGKCAHRDDQEVILREVMSADRVVLIYPLTRGFMNALMKNFVDRLFPLELPFIEFRKAEMSHRLRYDKYPDWGFVVHKEEDTTPAELEVSLELNSHLASFYKARLVLNEVTDTSPTEVAHETLRS